jgi:hypothetical protein
VASITELVSAPLNAISSQFSHGRAAEVTVNPSSQHGHQGNGAVFILTDANAKFELFRSVDNLTYISGENDLAAYYGCGSQTIYDFGVGTHFQFSETTALIKVYGFENDPKAIVDLFNAVPGTAAQADGHGGTMLGNIDFVGARLKASQVHFLSSDHPLATGGFV